MGSYPEPGFKFHITLGYQYRQLPKGEDEIALLDREFGQLCEAFKELTETALLQFEETQLTYFTDMTNFLSI